MLDEDDEFTLSISDRNDDENSLHSQSAMAASGLRNNKSSIL